MANLATFHTSISSTKFAKLFNSQAILVFIIPRVVVLVAISTSLTFYSFVMNVSLWMTFKVCLSVIRLTQRSLTVGSTSTIIIPRKLPHLPWLFCPKWLPWGRLKGGGGSGPLTFFWIVAKLQYLGVINVVDRHKIFMASLLFKAIKVRYLSACQLVIKSARRATTLRPTINKYVETLTELSSFQ